MAQDTRYHKCLLHGISGLILKILDFSVKFFQNDLDLIRTRIGKSFKIVPGAALTMVLIQTNFHFGPAFSFDAQ